MLYKVFKENAEISGYNNKNTNTNNNKYINKNNIGKALILFIFYFVDLIFCEFTSLILDIKLFSCSEHMLNYFHIFIHT